MWADLQAAGEVPRGLMLPPGVPQLNTAHRLYPYLQNAIVFDGVAMRDLRGRLGVSTVGAGTPAHGLGQLGHYLQLPVARVGMQATLGSAGGTPLSVVVLCVRNSSPDNSSEFRKISRICGTTNTGYAGFAFDLGNTYGSADQLYCTSHVYSGSGSGGTIFLNGRKVSGAAALTGMNKRALCIGATFPVVVTGDGNLTFGQMPSGAYGSVDAGVTLCLVYNRVLPDGAMQGVTQNPGAVFLWPLERLFFAFRAPSGTPHTATPGAGALTITGQAATATGAVTVQPGAGALALAGAAPAVTAGAALAPGAGALALLGLGVIAAAGVLMQPGAGAIAWQGRQPQVGQDGLPAEWLPQTARTSRNIRVRTPGNSLRARRPGTLRAPPDPK